jgi:hypothetical protein
MHLICNTKNGLIIQNIPVLTLSTEIGISIEENIQKIKEFIKKLKEMYA